ncbi:hypothetical protein Tco_0638331 [Tanacetum coccineum]
MSIVLRKALYRYKTRLPGHGMTPLSKVSSGKGFSNSLSIQTIVQLDNMANEHVPSPATTRSGDQILLFNVWVPIGKALTASTDVPSTFTVTTKTTSTLPPPTPPPQQSIVHQDIWNSRRFCNSDVCYHDPEKFEHVGPIVTTLHGGNNTTRMIKRFTMADDLKESSKITQVKGTKFKDHYIMYKEINA